MIGWIIGGLVATALLLIGWIIGTYNMFQIALQDIANQFSNIKTEYQRRADLFMNMVESVKGYAKFEKATLTQVIQARQGNFGGLKADQLEKMGELDKIFSRLMAVMEKYPELKAGEQFKELNSQITETEDRINIARTDYNAIIRDYNTMVTTFPSNIISDYYMFKKQIFFEGLDGIEKAPKVSMEGI